MRCQKLENQIINFTNFKNKLSEITIFLCKICHKNFLIVEFESHYNDCVMLLRNPNIFASITNTTIVEKSPGILGLNYELEVIFNNTSVKIFKEFYEFHELSKELNNSIYDFDSNVCSLIIPDKASKFHEAKIEILNEFLKTICNNTELKKSKIIQNFLQIPKEFSGQSSE